MKLAGVDVGGTFTDVVVVETDSGTLEVHKAPTTPDDPGEGLVEAVTAADSDVEGFDLLVYGTTVATNALLQHEGAKAGMITTKGFRDILHIARHQRPQHYSIQQEVPWQDRALVLRRYRKVVTERIGPRGEVIEPLDEQEVAEAARELASAGVDAVVIALLNSYRNPAHEERVAQIVQDIMPGAFITTSASVFPQFREYERFTTAAINGFVGPKLRDHIATLGKRLADAGVRAELRLMRSNGGVATSEVASRLPSTLLLSGPAAGVLAGAHIGRLCDRSNLITFDMGGTSADIGIVTPRGIVEAAARDTWIAGFPILIPMIDVHTVGAGGGSIAYVDPGGAFRVGPRSAGANPGPACYGHGGTSATVTDANVVLGRLRPEHFLGGAMRLDTDLARRAIEDLGKSLDLDPIQTAAGVITLVNHSMANAIRSRTIEKGHDPRKFTLMAFGGAGPLHAVEMARSLDIPEVLVPVYPGLTSAIGLLSTDLKYDLIQNEFMLDGEIDIDKLNRDFKRLDEQATEQLRRDGVGAAGMSLHHAADCRYVGQGYELRVPMPTDDLDAENVASFVSDFHRLHREEYGHAFPGNPVEIVNIRVVATGEMPSLPPFTAPEAGSLDDALVMQAPVYFPSENGPAEAMTSFYRREDLGAGNTLQGPAILVQTDSTVVLPPGASGEVLRTGDVRIRSAAAEPGSAEATNVTGGK